MTNVRSQTQLAANRTATKLDALLTLSRSLAGSRQEGITSDALDLLLAATGYTRGAAFVLEGGVLELVACRSLPEALRVWIDRLSLAEPAWFLAQAAVHARSLVSAALVSNAQAMEVDAGAFAAAGWTNAIACPIAAGREIHGVIMLASPTVPADDTAKATVEIASRLLALQIPHRPTEPRSDRAGAAQMAALAVLTCGLAAELDDHLTIIELRLDRQADIAAKLKRHGPAAVGLALETEIKAASGALQQAEGIAARLLSTFHSAFPVPPSEPSSGGASPFAPSSPRPAAALARAVSASSPDLSHAVPPSSRVEQVPSSGSPRSRAGDARAPAARRREAMQSAPTDPATPAAIAAGRSELRVASRFDTWRSEGTAPDAASPSKRPDMRTAPTERALPAFLDEAVMEHEAGAPRRR
jgi:hypothetical protein